MQFEDVLQAQERLQRDLGYKFEEMTSQERVSYLRWNSLALIVEVTETLNETDWKPWKPSTGVIRDEAFRQELADVFIFMMNMALAADIDADELLSYVDDKININRQRMGR